MRCEAGDGGGQPELLRHVSNMCDACLEPPERNGPFFTGLTCKSCWPYGQVEICRFTAID